jgi:hypothetical protein
MRWRPGEDGAILPCCGLHELLLLFFIPDLEKNGDRMTLAMEKGRARQGRESERGDGKLWTKADQYGLEGSGDIYWEVSGDRHRCPYFHGSEIKWFTFFKATWHISGARKSA